MITAKSLIARIGSVSGLYSTPQLIRLQNRGIEGYFRIRDGYNDNLISDPDFQRFYNYFYQLRAAYVSGDFKKEYYTIMQEIRDGADYSFEDISKRLYPVDGKHQFSFITKLMHTTNSDLPIYDNLVANILGIRYCTDRLLEDKIAHNRGVIDDMCRLYAELKADPDFQKIISDFDIMFPAGAAMPFAKKCDFIIWTLGQ